MPKKLLSALFALAPVALFPLRAEPYLFGNEKKPDQQIDIQYEKCLAGWGGENIKDWYRCAFEAESAWDQKLNEYYRALLPLLTPEERSLLIRSQRAWLAHFEAKKEMLTSKLDMNTLVGKEGYITVLDNLVQMKRLRALELHDYIELKKLQKQSSSNGED